MPKFQQTKYFKLTLESDNEEDLSEEVVNDLTQELQELANDAFSDVSFPDSDTDVKLDEIPEPKGDT